MPSQSLTLATLLDSDGSLANLSITEDALANGIITSRTINVASVTTDFVSEGFSNLYYTDARARLAISVIGAGSYDNANGIINIGGNSLNTSNVSEGANLYFTNARARAAISAFDNTIIYNEATGAISANAAALGGIGGGPNVISVNGQVGVVTLQTDDIAETTNLYFTNARVRAALDPDETILYNSSNGWLSIGQNVTPESNVVFNEANIKVLIIEDENYFGNGTISFSNNTNAFVFSNTLIPATDNLYNLGTTDIVWNTLHVHTINSNIINVSNTVIADNFVGSFTGDFIRTIIVSSDLNSIVIDQESNPSLFLPKGSNVVFDLSNPLLNGIGFEIGYDTNPLGNSEDVLGITYVVNGLVTTREDYTSSFNASNTRLMYFNVLQSTGNSLVYYSPEYPTWKAPLVVAPPANTDEVVEGDQNLYYSEERVQQVLSSVADGNVGVIYDENLNLLTLSQDITANADIEFRTVTANVAFYGDIYGNLYGNIFGFVANLDNFTTDDIVEGSNNAYFTNLRVRQSLSAGAGLDYSPILGQFSLPSIATVNANVYGGTTVIPVINVDSKGKVVFVTNVLPNYSNVTTNVAPNVNGVLNLGTSTRRWKDIYLSGNSIYLGNTTIREPSDGNITILNTANQPADLVANTGALIETGINIFFSNARAIAAVSSLPVTNLTAQLISTGNTTINDNSINTVTVTANLIGNVTGYVSTIDNFSTSNLKEGSNLYYTDQRVWSNVGSNIGDLWSNIYAIAGGGILSTSNVAEGANLYFTNTRTRAALSGGTGVDYNPSTGTISLFQNVSTHSDVTFANVIVTGNLSVQGNALLFESNSLLISDPLFQIGKNPIEGDALDLGFFAHYKDTGDIERHAGLFRDATDGQFKLFANLDPEPVNTVDVSNLSYEKANLVVEYLVGKVTDISNHTTTELAEGANLYFTNARARAAISVLGTGSYDEANGIINIVGGVESVNGLTGNVVLITSNVAEGANLYFTNTRVQSYLSNVDGNIIPATDNYYNLGSPTNWWKSLYLSGSTIYFREGGNLTVSDNVLTFYDGAGNSVFSSGTNSTVIGNLLVTGETTLSGNTQINAATLTVNDGLIKLANANPDDLLDIGFYGKYIEESASKYTGLFRDATYGIYKFFKDLTLEPNVLVNTANATFALAEVEASKFIGQISDLSNHTTSNLTEGTNLYFTNTRVWANVGANIDSLWATVYNITTSNVPEGANLYFTNTRSRAAISNSGAVINYDPVTGIISANVAAIGFDPEPVWANITAGLTTDFVPEANNKYFTNARVLAAVAGPDSNLANAIFNRITVNNGIDNGLNWATTATGSYANATVSTNGFATNLDIRVGQAAGDSFRIFAPGNQGLVYNNYAVWHANSGILTTNIPEGSNLYYTNDRVWANVGANISYLLDTIDNITTGSGANAITTSNVAEGANLYYTNARARAAISVTDNGGDGSLSYNNSTGVLTFAGPSTTDYRAAFSAGTGVSISSGVISISQAVNTSSTVTFTKVNAGTVAFPVYGGSDYANITSVETSPGVTRLQFFAGDNNVDGIDFNVISANNGVLINGFQVWHAGNDGSGSGLDADLLDGIQATSFLQTGTTTTDIGEGTNLYFSNTRVRAAVGTANATSLIYYSGNGNFQVNVEAVGSVSSVNGQTGVVVLTTANVTEDTNLYFTNARARAAVSGGTGVSYNQSTGSFSIGQAVGPTNDVTFADLIVTGNLTVQGNALQFESNTLIINDPLIQIGKNPVSGDTVDLGFFGHYIQTGDVERHAGLFRDATDGNFKLFTNLDPEPATIVDTANASFSYANLFVNNLYGTVFGSVNTISNFSTTNLTEGANLYFTNTRARAAVGAVGSNLVYYEANGNFQVIISGGGGAVDSVNGQIGTVVLTTANVAEDANLYFTNTRARAAFSGSGGIIYDSANGIISINNTIATSNVIYSDDTFTGNGVASIFTLSSSAIRNDSLVVIDGLVQFYETDYTISGNSLIFTTAPAQGESIKVLRFQSFQPTLTPTLSEDYGFIV